MKKIIHLSDLHYGWKKWANETFKKIISNIHFEKEPTSAYVVVVTGDVVDNANHGKQIKVREQLTILKNAGFDVLVIPGNHDYGNGIYGKKKFVKEFKKVYFDDTEIQYPKVDIIYDPESPKNFAEAIAFIGLDSMAEELGLLDHLWAQGELGSAQLNRLANVLNSSEVISCGKRVIYLHHHPFDPSALHELKDSDKLKDVVTNYISEGKTIDALLYGHNHLGKSHHGKWGIPRCYDGSSATGKKKEKSQPILQRVIDLKRDPRWDYNGEFHL